MPAIKNMCKKCGYIETEKSNWKSKLRSTGKASFYVIIGVFAATGILAFYSFMKADSYQDIGQVTDLGAAYAAITNIKSNFITTQDYERLKNETLIIVNDCGDEDKNCQARMVYDHIQNYWDYKKGTDTNAIKVFEEKECDCDECSYLYITMLRTIGIKSYLRCTGKGNVAHCWAMTKIDNQKIKADITKGIYEVLNEYYVQSSPLSTSGKN